MQSLKKKKWFNYKEAQKVLSGFDGEKKTLIMKWVKRAK